MIAVDTNVLVYASRQELPHHARALELLVGLAESDRPWGLPWPCAYEYLRVVTHPRVFDPPTDLDDALDNLASLLDSPSVVPMGEGPTHRAHLLRMVDEGRASGNLAHDAHIAALAVEHGVTELWTADKDFARFPSLTIRNPLDEGSVHEPRRRYGSRTRDRSRSTAPSP